VEDAREAAYQVFGQRGGLDLGFELRAGRDNASRARRLSGMGRRLNSRFA
jgi:hypothetical protein